MPILKNAKKALRVSKRRAIVNHRVKSKVKSTIDTFKSKPDSINLNQVFSMVDKAVKKNLFHRNKAARIKSRLSKKLAAAK